MKKAHFIFFVSDQDASTTFYEKALGLEASLHVPGMTEFVLNEGAVLGLMPIAGIKKLLGEKIKDPDYANGIPRAELYWIVENVDEAFQRAVSAGGKEVSPVLKRNWGHSAGYFADPDGHIIALAAE